MAAFDRRPGPGVDGSGSPDPHQSRQPGCLRIRRQPWSARPRHDECHRNCGLVTRPVASVRARPDQVLQSVKPSRSRDQPLSSRATRTTSDCAWTTFATTDWPRMLGHASSTRSVVIGWILILKTCPYRPTRSSSRTPSRAGRAATGHCPRMIVAPGLARDVTANDRQRARARP